MSPLWHRYGVLLALAVLVAALPLVLPSSYYLRVATLVWISALAVVGLNLLMGYAGQVSLGHAGFFGLGAYAVAVGPTHLGASHRPSPSFSASPAPASWPSSSAGQSCG